MTLSTLGVGLNVTPTVIARSIDHYANRRKRRQKPTVHLSYDVSLGLIRKFLIYASKHTVEDVQAFTSQWVPSPTWVHTEQVKIPSDAIDSAAAAIVKQLGPKGIEQIGGKTWWRWRHDKTDLKAEWIEMKADRKRRLKTKQGSNRVMLYVHGGAYFFGSVDEHRYQLQRHARKLKARVLAPRYRLSPQFPFPCGLLDCLATYLHLLTTQDPSTIVLAGDSAGGGMVVSLLVILRDQGLPLPAGAVLISPWVDLTHSFPSVADDNAFDYIPPYGFMQKPSIAWPPPNADDLQTLRNAKPNKKPEVVAEKNENGQATSAGKAVEHNVAGNTASGLDSAAGTTTLPSAVLSLLIDGKTVELRDQIQMYATNEQLSNPLVSPVLQASLGGLPPLLILVGGGEMLRDEQIYLAHKAANPSKYAPSDTYLKTWPGSQEQIKKYPATLVQLQVWDDLCHVAPTLSFTRPAKYMYRAIAQFSAWALAQAQRTDIDIIDDDAVSVISSDSSGSDDAESRSRKAKQDAVNPQVPTNKIEKAGEDIPHFRNHMVRERVDRNGNVFPLAAEKELPALQMSPDAVGVIKPGPVRKWMAAKSLWDSKYARQRQRVHKQRLRETKKGYLEFTVDGVNEQPPPSALAGRRGLPGSEAPKSKKSLGLSLWTMMGSKHDEDAVEREEKLDRRAEAKVTVTTPDGGAAVTTTGGANVDKARSGSRRRTLSYQGKANENSTMSDLTAQKNAFADTTAPVAGAAVGSAVLATTAAAPSSAKENDIGKHYEDGKLSPTFIPLSQVKQSDGPSPIVHPADASKDPLVLEGTNVTLAQDSTRPKADGVAFPFKLNKSLGDHSRNPSMVTLQSSLEGGVDAPRTPGPSGSEETRPVPDKTVQHEGAADPDVTPKANKTKGIAALSVASRSTTSSTIGTTVPRQADDAVTTPPVVAPNTIFTSGPTVFPADTTSSSSVGPVRTETPNLEKQLGDMGIVSRGNGPGDATPRGAESTGWATPRAGSISTMAPSESGDTLSRFETAEEE